MRGFAQVPAALCAAGVVLEWCEESPTWLLVSGSYEQSRRSLACLQNIRGREAVEWQRSVHEATQASLGDSKGADAQPFSPFRHVEPKGDNIDRTPTKEVRSPRALPPATPKARRLDACDGDTRTGQPVVESEWMQRFHSRAVHSSYVLPCVW
jgi:hypothetical protein